MSRPRVLILGGGPAAAGVALTLAEAGLRPLVIERATTLRERPGECLTANFRPLLDRLDLVELLDGHRRLPGLSSRWDHDATFEREAIFAAQGEGWLLDRRRFTAQLIAATRERGAIWRLGWTLARVERRDAAWHVELQREAERRAVEADYLIDATGRAARLLRMIGEPRRTIDRLFGSWLVLPARAPAGRGPVMIEADAEGWWYATELPDARRSLVWFSDYADADAAPSADELLRRAGERALIADLIGGDEARELPPPTVHPAASVRAARACGPGWFAVGDAAQAFDPLSSYGIGSALATGYYAARALLSEWAGDAQAQASYQGLLDQRWAQYLDRLAERYAAPHSWSQARFWVERRRRIAELARA